MGRTIGHIEIASDKGCSADIFSAHITCNLPRMNSDTRSSHPNQDCYSLYFPISPSLSMFPSPMDYV